MREGSSRRNPRATLAPFRKRLQSLLALLLALLPAAALAHGPTLCLGTVKYGDGNTVSVDMRFGVGVLHKYVDPDNNARVTDDEWTSSVPVLRGVLGSGLHLGWADGSTTPTEMKFNLTSGAEIQVLASFDVPTSATALSFAVPVLRKFPGAPPSQVSVWYNETMVRGPELLWFDKELSFDRTKHSP